MREEIILSGAGGQGLILAGTILAEAAGVFEGREVVQTQSYGIQARGGASQSTVIISDHPIKFPEVLTPGILLCLSQEAYERYSPGLRKGGQLIVDRDLVKIAGAHADDIEVIAFPFTAEAEKIGRRIAANLVALGVLATVTGVVKPESLALAIPSRLPERNVALALEALRTGVKLGEARHDRT
ncbi:MAG: 2-oxoacid:ferredoxin oxidoreductase subunit gamma [Anaerolineae bacterium]